MVIMKWQKEIRKKVGPSKEEEEEEGEVRMGTTQSLLYFRLLKCELNRQNSA